MITTRDKIRLAATIFFACAFVVSLIYSYTIREEKPPANQSDMSYLQDESGQYAEVIILGLRTYSSGFDGEMYLVEYLDGRVPRFQDFPSEELAGRFIELLEQRDGARWLSAARSGE